jgi:ArsR family transcriptional regulator, cadmium/lead-responsive transcriptional repressor
LFITADTTNLSVKARLFRGFSDPSRLKILETLRSGGQTVGAIVERTGLSQSNVSNHLGCLRDCGLVSFEQRGKFAEYRLSDPRVEQLLSLAGTLLADVARGVYECTRYSVEEPSNE